jgi:very-short-patch-repair endonuclease
MTEAEKELWFHLGQDWWPKVAVLDYIVDFIEPTLDLAIEVNGKNPAAKRNLTQDYRVYRELGLKTLRLLSTDILDDQEKVQQQISDFLKNPPVPVEPRDTEVDIFRREQRKQALEEIRTRVSAFEIDMLGRNRQEVLKAFAVLSENPRDYLDEEVINRLADRVIYWPEEGYVSPGLQKITYLKRNSG